MITTAIFIHWFRCGCGKALSAPTGGENCCLNCMDKHTISATHERKTDSFKKRLYDARNREDALDRLRQERWEAQKLEIKCDIPDWADNPEGDNHGD